MNEDFNQKLIKHGTDKGVPFSELPDPRTFSQSSQLGHNSTGMTKGEKAVTRGSSQTAKNAKSSANYASSY